ncbi:MAG: HIT family protein [Planctomycetota bacterium]|jgi:ATP adenylyltransferase
MNNLWAPWRSDYVRNIDRPEEEGCFICNAVNSSDDKSSLVLYRAKSSLVIMNRYPYNPGHLMICSLEHKGEIENVDSQTAAEMWRVLVMAKEILKLQMNPQGFNIGINQGRCAGAGIVDHLHIHIVPRWNGDSNFMSATGNTRVISQALEELYDQLRPDFQAMTGGGDE